MQRAGTELVAPDEPVLLVGPPPWWQHGGRAAVFASHGWSSIEADDAQRGRWLASIQRVCLAVVGGDEGDAVSRAVSEVRSVSSVPIVVVGGHRDDVIPLLAAGVDAVLDPADDAEVMFARVSAMLRRADHRWGPGVRYLEAGDLRVDLWTQQCTLHHAPLLLSPTEYALLTLLMTRPDVALPVNTIISKVWGWHPSDGRNALRIIINRLRRKLDDDPLAPTYVASVRGIGYRFVTGVTEVADSPEPKASRRDVTPLFDDVGRFATELASLDGLQQAASAMADVVDRAGIADALAVFAVNGDHMQLVTSRHMPVEWCRQVEGGVPLDPSFASAHSVLSGETVQFGDVRAVGGHFDATARRLADHGFRACHFVPLHRAGEVWGHVGLVRRSCQPFDALAMAYVRSLCAVLALFVTTVHDRATAAAACAAVPSRSPHRHGTEIHG